MRLALGFQGQLALTGRFDEATFCITEDGTYNSDAPGVATVENVRGRRGLISSEGLGSAVVSVYIGPLNDTIQIVVAEPEITFVELRPAALTMSPLEAAQLKAFATFSDGTINDVTNSPETEWIAVNVNPVVPVVALNGVKGLVRALRVGTGRVNGCTRHVCADDDETDRRAVITVVP
ncbi:MAG: hypothetical protein EXR76_03865 [Myxococcales bacterium]|nr:hypothetical protein [Myxococcales bacterium]